MTLAMSKCGSCDQPLPESARFCGSCGIKQEADLDLAPVVQTGAAIDDATPRPRGAVDDRAAAVALGWPRHCANATSPSPRLTVRPPLPKNRTPAMNHAICARVKISKRRH